MSKATLKDKRDGKGVTDEGSNKEAKMVKYTSPHYARGGVNIFLYSLRAAFSQECWLSGGNRCSSTAQRFSLTWHPLRFTKKP
jgi:hypothetical protein